MSAPWLTTDTAAAALATALLVGVAFGAALESAGLGSARKLVSQFYGEDLTVLKVMFTAIIVAMLGAFWLGAAGVVDLSRLAVPETFLVPQLVGGLIFGAGMAVSGLCPGTSCVAAASGRGDGLAALLGMFAGVLGTGLVFERLAGFYASTARGPLTLPAWLGLSHGAVVLTVVVLALVAFRVAEAVEARARRAVALGDTQGRSSP
jgi:uncharacterized protein